MDALLTWADNGEADLMLDGGDLARAAGYQSASIISLFSDGRAGPDDWLPDRTDDRRGWWADAFTDAGPLGSRLWLLAREKIVPGIEQRIEQFAREALQWLIDDGRAQRLDIEARRIRTDAIGLCVTVVVDERDRPTPFEIAERLTIDGLDVEIVLRLSSLALALRPYPEYEFEG